MLDLSKLTAGKQLTELDNEILHYFVEHIDEVQDMGVRDVAKQVYTSPASVIRLSKKLGYTGYTDMYYSLLPLIKKAENEPVGNRNSILHTQLEDVWQNHSPKLMQEFSEHVLNMKQQYIFIYATGFSSIMTEYMYKKLLVLGRKTILASGSDSIGVFENNLDDIGAIIVVSKSGETEQVYEKVKKATNANIYTVSFTRETQNRIADLSDLNFQIFDAHKLDDRNMLPNVFYLAVLHTFESLIECYLSQLPAEEK